jgi:hypothetical protein
MICCLSPTVGIARYMHRLLQPIYDQVAYSTTFFKESNAVHALENYAQQGLLHPKTLFATLHVNDLCTIVPHEQLIEILQRFLNDLVLMQSFNWFISFYKINYLFLTTIFIDKSKVVLLIYHSIIYWLTSICSIGKRI